MRFSMVGGYYWRQDGVLMGGGIPDPITVLGDRLAAGGAPPTGDEATAALATLRSLGVRNVLVVVVEAEDPGHGWARAAEAVLGPMPPADGGVLRWSVG